MVVERTVSSQLIYGSPTEVSNQETFRDGSPLLASVKQSCETILLGGLLSRLTLLSFQVLRNQIILGRSSLGLLGVIIKLVI